MTIGELITKLQELPLNGQVFLSSDEEGNSYSSVENGWGYDGSLSFHKEDNVLLIIPWSEGLEWEDICPKQAKKDNQWVEEEMERSKNAQSEA